MTLQEHYARISCGREAAKLLVSLCHCKPEGDLQHRAELQFPWLYKNDLLLTVGVEMLQNYLGPITTTQPDRDLQNMENYIFG